MKWYSARDCIFCLLSALHVVTLVRRAEKTTGRVISKPEKAARAQRAYGRGYEVEEVLHTGATAWCQVSTPNLSRGPLAQLLR